MEGNFKGCLKKPFTNFVCVTCLEVFHTSCLERKKYTTIRGHKIYCSGVCDWEGTDFEDKINRFKKEILKLKNDAALTRPRN